MDHMNRKRSKETREPKASTPVNGPVPELVSILILAVLLIFP
jgi:hypothetical protein